MAACCFATKYIASNYPAAGVLRRSDGVLFGLPKTKRHSINFSHSLKRWQSAPVSANNKQKQIPLLMLITRGREDSLRFEDLSKEEDRIVQVNISAGGVDDDPYFGRYFSSRGWLIRISDPNVMTLIHPFSSSRLQLPSVESLVSHPYDDNWICEEGAFITFLLTKCVLSSSSSSQPEVVVIYGRKGYLGYARPGGVHRVWRRIHNARHFVDAIYLKKENQFYAITAFGQIFAIDLDADDTACAAARLVAEFPREFIYNNSIGLRKMYLIEDDGKLLVVSRVGGEVAEENTFRTWGFRVFEIDLRTNECNQIKSLGNRSLFLGFNSSISLHVDAVSGCLKPNCVYFTDDLFADNYWYLVAMEHTEVAGKDTGIYHMDDGSIEPLPFPFFNSNNSHPPLMWVERELLS